MVPYDTPTEAHDMILRFMGVDFSSIVTGSAKIPSSIGADSKPQFLEGAKTTETPVPTAGKTPQQAKAMWEGAFIFFVYTQVPDQYHSILQRRLGSARPRPDIAGDRHLPVVSRAP